VSTVHGLWHGAGAVAVGAVAGVVVASWIASSPHATQAPPDGPKADTATVAAESVPYHLYTHCGVGEARVGNRYFVAVHPLSDGSGNPPAGWGNPDQAGTMTLVSPAEAVFTDSAGHRVKFRVRPGARTFLHVCA
jgi:hypothetical protein